MAREPGRWWSLATDFREAHGIGRPDIGYAPFSMSGGYSLHRRLVNNEPAFLTATLRAVRPGTRSMRRGDEASLPLEAGAARDWVQLLLMAHRQLKWPGLPQRLSPRRPAS
jgi:hypothetical protein